jgi:hypothetical protein
VAEDKNNEEEKFDFTPEGEVLDYISLQQAVLLSRRQARESDERYKERLGWEEIVWAELRSETVGEDYYRIVLQFRRPTRGILEEQTGEEEFLSLHHRTSPTPNQPSVAQRRRLMEKREVHPILRRSNSGHLLHIRRSFNAHSARRSTAQDQYFALLVAR